MSDNMRNMIMLPNGIKVDQAVLNILRGPSKRMKDWEWRKAVIRDFIKENAGKHLQVFDFGVACYDSTTPGMASYALKRLIKEGRITKVKTRINGKLGFEWKWHDQRQIDPARSNGPVTTIVPPRPTPEPKPEVVPSGKRMVSDNFDTNVFEFLRENPQYSEGVVKFRNWLTKPKEV